MTLSTVISNLPHMQRNTYVSTARKNMIKQLICEGLKGVLEGGRKVFTFQILIRGQ